MAEPLDPLAEAVECLRALIEDDLETLGPIDRAAKFLSQFEATDRINFSCFEGQWGVGYFFPNPNR